MSALVHLRSAAGCIGQGWRMVADNIWSLLRGSWPVITLCSIWGTFLGVVTVLMPFNVAGWAILGVTGLLLVVFIVLQVALLVRTYHRLGYFPNAGALITWRMQSQGLLSQVGTQFMSIITHVHRWGNLIAILIVGGLVKLIILLFALLPLAVLAAVGYESYTALLQGDTINTPSSLWLLAACFGAVGGTLCFVAALPTLLPMAFFLGSLHQEDKEREQSLVQKNGGL